MGLLWDTEKKIRTIQGGDVTEDSIFELAYEKSDKTMLGNYEVRAILLDPFKLIGLWMWSGDKIKAVYKGLRHQIFLASIVHNQ